MRIDPTKSATLPTLETQKVPALTNGRLPRSSVSLHWANNTLPALELGAELEAVVIDELTDGRLLLKIGGNLVEADSPGGIGSGQQLRLRVEQLQPQVVLQITDVEPTLQAEAARLLRQHLPAHADSGKLLEHLQTLLTAQIEAQGEGAPGMVTVNRLHGAVDLLLADQTPTNPGRVQTLLQDGGLYYEAKLAWAVHQEVPHPGELVDRDLKGLLLTALEDSKHAPFGAELLRTINAQLNNLETQQAVNLLAQLSDGGLRLQIPFFNGASFSTATLSIERDGKGTPRKGHGENGYNLLFLLDLENFGRTRIDAHVAEENLRVIFYFDRDSSVALANEALPEFRQVLLGLGYREALLVARPLTEIPEEKRQKFDVLAVGAPASIHLLDMKA